MIYIDARVEGLPAKKVKKVVQVIKAYMGVEI
jgi:hypothetical protein